MTENRDTWNATRFVRGTEAGHYESYFQRANHPTLPKAFWIRYTVYSPKGRPDQAVGELWAVYFDGQANRIVAAKEVFPIGECRFSATGLDVAIGGAVLDDRGLRGAAKGREHRIEWTLAYAGEEPPLLLLPRGYYDQDFPKAKVAVGTPNARFDGTLLVDTEAVNIDGWVGSQNHNWGSRHTDDYAWGQVAGFDDAPDAFLECSTARIRLGPLWSPRFTVVVIRLDGREYALNGLLRAMASRGRYGYFFWQFEARGSGIRVHGRMEAPKSAFVGLRYDNPPGGWKTCLNTKLAACEVQVARMGQAVRTLSTRHRAAFEILTDDTSHGVRIVA